MAVKQSIKYYFPAILFCLLFPGKVFSQSSLLNKKISIVISGQTVENALTSIGKAGNISFSYNSDIVPVDSVISFKTADKEILWVLNALLGDSYSYVTSGHYIIILKKNQEKTKSKNDSEKTYTISGYLIDSKTGQKIISATIYSINSKESALTDENGRYSIIVSPEYNELIFSKHKYVDTVIVVKPADNINMDVTLMPRPDEYLAPITSLPPKKLNIDNIQLVRGFVSEEMMVHSENMEMNEVKRAQVSFLPFAGTNRLISGAVVNKMSFNVLAGYSAGVDGTEIGGLMNIVRKNVKGFQLAGLGNVTGKDMKGFQMAGLSNYNLGKVRGVQLAGLANTVFDSIRGVQLAGISNMIKGSMKGVQVSGLTNIAAQDAEAFQLAGLANISLGSCTGQQVAGFANLCNEDNRGVQVAGFSNVTRNNTKGLQLSGFVNYSGQLDGMQLGYVNCSGKVTGFQLGYVNIADTVSGMSVGFLSYIRKGYHSINLHYDEMMSVNADVYLGTYNFYNIFGLTANLNSNMHPYGVTYGIGKVFFYRHKLNFNTDLCATKYLMDYDWTQNDNYRARFSIHLNYNFTDHIGIFAGPAYNVFFTSTDNTVVRNYISENVSAKESVKGKVTLQSWLGYSIGLKIRF